MSNHDIWKGLKCWKCGKPAHGFNIFGAFCSDKDHYPRKEDQGNFKHFRNDKVAGMIVEND